MFGKTKKRIVVLIAENEALKEENTKLKAENAELSKKTVSQRTTQEEQLSFGYETRSVNKLINAKGINVFSFDNFSFENFSFETGFANSYSVKCNERNFNFIIFRFVSDNDSDCIVNTFTVLYKINKSNKGVE